VQLLILTIKDDDIGVNQFMGKVEIPVQQVIDSGSRSNAIFEILDKKGKQGRPTYLTSLCSLSLTPSSLCDSPHAEFCCVRTLMSIFFLRCFGAPALAHPHSDWQIREGGHHHARS